MTSDPVNAAPESRKQLAAALTLAGVLFVALFADVIFRDRNFIFRDAGHFYYPYFRLVADEWGAGRVPLWSSQESGGVPLAANPTSSVFYPLKVIFALSYPLAYKWYSMGHVALAWGACFLAARGFGISSWGSALAATAYAFSGFVIFQLYNIIFLCGAAWLPLALLAVDRVARTPSAGWMALLGIVLAAQVLSGDPQTAQVTGLVAIPYVLIYQMGARAGLVALLGVVGIGTALVQLGDTVNGLRAAEAGAVMASLWRPPLWAAIAGLAVALGVYVWLRRLPARPLRDPSLRRSMALLVGGGVLGGLLAAIQVLPTMHFVRATDRAAPDAPHEPVAFSFFPARVAELLFPTVFGKQLPINSRWAPFSAVETGIWVPTIYMGLLPVLLGLFSFRFFGGSPTARWLTWMTVLTFWLALGKFGGPLWIWEENLGKQIDLVRAKRGTILFGRSDGLYWACEQSVPGFRAFRYPSKMLVFCCVGIALLGGMGFDRLVGSDWRRFRRTLAGVAISAAALLLLALILRGPILRWLANLPASGSSFGPLDAAGAWREVALSLGQCIVISLVAWLILALGPRLRSFRHLQAGLLVLLVCVDLYVADRWLMLTDEQSIIDAKPTVVAAIEAEEAKEDQPQPFRVHRTRIYNPLHWHGSASEDRMLEMSRWERNTIQPKYGLPFGIDYTVTTGTMGIYDVEFFFAPWVVPTPPQIQSADKRAPEVMTYFPRHGYDLWNTKYFVLPSYVDLDHEERGVFTMLTNVNGVPCPVIAQSPPDKEDFQVIKNPDAFPRAWIVHQGDFRLPIAGLLRKDREGPMEELLYRERDGGLKLWKGFEYGNYPLRSTVMLEPTTGENLIPFSSGAPPQPSEFVRIESHQSNRVVMKAHLESPGFVVLADTYYPGWRATIDGEPAPIIRANRAMRAVPTPAGDHTIEMTFRSIPFEIGAVITGLTLLALAVWPFTGVFRHRALRRITHGNAVPASAKQTTAVATEQATAPPPTSVPTSASTTVDSESKTRSSSPATSHEAGEASPPTPNLEAATTPEVKAPADQKPPAAKPAKKKGKRRK